MKSWPNVSTKQLQSCKKVQQKSGDIAWKANFSLLIWDRLLKLIILKTIGNRKGDCAWSCSRWQTQPVKICKSQCTNQCHSLRTFYWFVLCNLQIFSGCVCHLEQLHAQSPFLFPIVFSINLIPFFDISSVLAVHSRGLFGYVLLYFTCATARSQELLFVVLDCHALRALDSSCRLRTPRRVCICIGSTRCRGNHMHDHSRFQRDIDDVTGVSLSLSLSLSLLLTKVTHAQYRKRFRASYNVATSHNVVWLETIEISKQRTAFIWCFAQEVDWCLKDCDKQRLQTSVSINLWKIFAGHTGDWFDVRTASICTTDLWVLWKVSFWTVWNLRWLPRVEPGIRVTLTLRRSKIAWGGPSTWKLHQSFPFGPRDSGKILKFGSSPRLL